MYNEFRFGKDYTDKVLKLLLNLYEGINAKKKHNYSIDNPDYINRMNYYDNFVEHLTNLDQSFIPCKYFHYNEY